MLTLSFVIRLSVDVAPFSIVLVLHYALTASKMINLVNLSPITAFPAQFSDRSFVEIFIYDFFSLNLNLNLNPKFLSIILQLYLFRVLCLSNIGGRKIELKREKSKPPIRRLKT